MKLDKVFDVWGTIRRYVTLGLLAALLVTSGGWYVTSQKLDSERIGRENDRLAYVAEQHAYEAKALAEKMKKEKEDRERAEEADAKYGDLLARYNRNLRVYATNEGKVGGYYLPSPTPSPEGANRSGVGAPLPPASSTSSSGEGGEQFVIISYDDAGICAINTARLVIANEWIKEVQKSYQEAP